ncbi:MAG: SEL1-like repeat protein [Lentisphaerae bacterium]|nr:SEL1-like repeat protein [Lentisphaerota bacterium]
MSIRKYIMTGLLAVLVCGAEVFAQGKKTGKSIDETDYFQLGITYFFGLDGVKQDDNAAVKHFRKAAEQGNPSAMSMLGNCYALGRGVERNQKTAAEWQKKAADKGDPSAKFLFGLHCYNGTGVPQDFQKARELFRAAADTNNPWAQFSLGKIYENGKGVKQDYKEAAKWYRKAAARNDVFAAFALGRFSLYGKGMPRNLAAAERYFKQTFTIILELTMLGNNFAQCQLGYCYQFGIGTKKNLPEAIKWYARSAAQGNREANVYLGFCYLTGKGVPKNRREAEKHFREVFEKDKQDAAHGDPVAMYYLGNHYNTGHAVKQDYKEAVKWHRNAYRKKYTSSAIELGIHYFYGRGVPQNYAEAEKYFREAAELDRPVAKFYMGLCSEKLRKDPAEAAAWYKAAVPDLKIDVEYFETGYSCFALGYCYEHGLGGVKKDLNKAICLYRKAAEYEYIDAQNALKLLGVKL